MGRTQLRTLLASASSIVFEARPRELCGDASGEPGQGTTKTLNPFFDIGLLKNAIVLKSVLGVDGDGDARLQTRLYFPFDDKRVANGGRSLVIGDDFSAATLADFFDANEIEPARIEADLRKIAVLCKTPSFSPFLLRDAFERAGIVVDPRYFRVSDVEADGLRESLKARLKPLAAMALNLSPTLVGNAQLDMLAKKLWELDDPAFLMPFARALKIDETDAIDVFYAWIGVSYFQREFGKRQLKLRELANWLSAKPPFPEGTKESVIREFEDDRKQMRAGLRWAWTSSAAVFDRYAGSYDALIAGNASPFVQYLREVRADFVALGARLSVIEQCLNFHDATAAQERGSILSSEILREVARSMREGGYDSDANRAAA